MLGVRRPGLVKYDLEAGGEGGGGITTHNPISVFFCRQLLPPYQNGEFAEFERPQQLTQIFSTKHRSREWLYVGLAKGLVRG